MNALRIHFQALNFLDAVKAAFISDIYCSESNKQLIRFSSLEREWNTTTKFVVHKPHAITEIAPSLLYEFTRYSFQIPSLRFA